MKHQITQLERHYHQIEQTMHCIMCRPFTCFRLYFWCDVQKTFNGVTWYLACYMLVVIYQSASLVPVDTHWQHPLGSWPQGMESLTSCFRREKKMAKQISKGKLSSCRRWVHLVPWMWKSKWGAAEIRRWYNCPHQVAASALPSKLERPAGPLMSSVITVANTCRGSSLHRCR